jgi:hypothetical protein
MAECNLQTITVSEAKIVSRVNGNYHKVASNEKENYYLKEDNTSALQYTTEYVSGVGQVSGWQIVDFRSGQVKYYASQDPADCPIGLTFIGVNGANTESFVLGEPSQPLVDPLFVWYEDIKKTY